MVGVVSQQLSVNSDQSTAIGEWLADYQLPITDYRLPISELAFTQRTGTVFANVFEDATRDRLC
jgi:hypothetical protein